MCAINWCARLKHVNLKTQSKSFGHLPVADPRCCLDLLRAPRPTQYSLIQVLNKAAIFAELVFPWLESCDPTTQPTTKPTTTPLALEYQPWVCRGKVQVDDFVRKLPETKTLFYVSPYYRGKKLGKNIRYHVYIISYHIMSYHIISYYIISYHIILHHIISYYIIWYYIISYYIISYHIILYYIILYHIVLYYIILYNIIFYDIILYYVVLYCIVS